MITTAQFEKTNATVKKIVDWAISRQAPKKFGEGSTTNIKAYRMVPKPEMTRARGCAINRSAYTNRLKST
jgi:hypothetical protein